MKHTTLITGASRGIGRALANTYARHGHDLVLVARSKNQLEQVADDIRSRHGRNVHTYAIDLTADDGIDMLMDALQKETITISHLVNNAGIGVYGNFADTPLEKEQEMIDLNIRTLTTLSKKFLDICPTDVPATILNVASTASFQPGPHMAVYFASKAYVLSFSEALAEEMRNTNVRVTALCPGPTRTTFEQSTFNDPTFFGQHAMEADVVADIGYNALLRGTRVAIPGWRNKVLVHALRATPRRLVTTIVRKMFE